MCSLSVINWILGIIVKRKSEKLELEDKNDFSKKINAMCNHTNKTQRFGRPSTRGYNELSSEQKELIQFWIDESIFPNHNRQLHYIIHGSYYDDIQKDMLKTLRKEFVQLRKTKIVNFKNKLDNV